MADESTSVGKIKLDIEISQSSLNKEMNKLGGIFNSNINNMFGQTTNFVKSSLGRMTNSFKTFSQVGTGSSDKVAKNINKLNSDLEKTQVKIEETNNKLAQLYAEQDNIIQLYRDMPAFSGMTNDESLQQMLNTDTDFTQLTNEVERLESRLQELRLASDTTRNSISELEGSLSNTSNATERTNDSVERATNNTRKFGREIRKTGNIAQKSTGKVANFANMIDSSFRRILRRIFIYNLIYKGIRGLMSYIGSALKTNNQFANSLNTIKTNLRVAFQPIYDFILPALNALMKAISTATTYIASAISALFGKSYKQSYDAAKKLEASKKAMDGYGNSVKKTKKQLAGFDEINQLDLSKDDDGQSGAGGFEMTMPNEKDFDMGYLNKLNDLLKEFYNNWGMKDFFKGFRDGLDLINFDNIKTNLFTVFSELAEIANTAKVAMQPMFEALGKMLGTSIKYGIAVVGNYFEAITLGWANFATNMKSPIQKWIKETSQSITNGFDNSTMIFEVIGGSWLNSINKYKEPIAKTVEDMLTNSADTYRLFGTITADIFEISTGKLKEFTKENKANIQVFTDSIADIFIGAWDFINQIWHDVLDALRTFWEDWGKDIVSGLMDVVTTIKGWFLYLWNDLVKPVWDEALRWLRKIWDDSLKDIIDEFLGFVGRIGKYVIDFWNNILGPLIDKILKILVPVFRTSFKVILGVVGSVINGIGAAIKNLLKILNGIIDFIVGIFTGNWEKAWQGLATILKGIASTFVAIFKAPINSIIGLVNGAINGFNKIKIPSWVPGLGGKGIDIPKIPKLAKGGIIDRPTLAMVGERGKEAVMPLENNTGWIAELASQLSSFLGSSNGDTTIIVKIGEDTITEKVVSNINRQSRISGKTIITV